MKLSHYLPNVPQMQQTMADLNKQISLLDVMKSTGDSGRAPTIGLDQVVNTWVRHQMAYRQQLVMDLQTIAMSVEEIRGPLSHISGEVFRRGIEIIPSKENPDKEERDRIHGWIKDCNVFDQSLEEVLRQFHFDVNSLDDGFLYLAKEYKDNGDGTVTSRLQEIRRLNPALVEFDLDAPAKAGGTGGTVLDFWYPGVANVVIYRGHLISEVDNPTLATHFTTTAVNA